jgi:hypothetical protein
MRMWSFVDARQGFSGRALCIWENCEISFARSRYREKQYMDAHRPRLGVLNGAVSGNCRIARDNALLYFHGTQ